MYAYFNTTYQNHVLEQLSYLQQQHFLCPFRLVLHLILPHKIYVRRTDIFHCFYSRHLACSVQTASGGVEVDCLKDVLAQSTVRVKLCLSIIVDHDMKM